MVRAEKTPRPRGCTAARRLDRCAWTPTASREGASFYRMVFVPGIQLAFLIPRVVWHELAWVSLTWPLFGVAKGAVGLAYGAIENRTQRNQREQHPSGQHWQRLLVRHRIGPAGVVLHVRWCAHQVWLFLVRQAFARLWATGALVWRQIGIMLRR